MNFIFIILTLLNILNFINASKNGWNNNNSIRLRNTSFKIVIFKEKKIPKLINYFKQKYKNYYNKVLITISDSINEYENLSFEDKQVIDFMLSLIIQ